MNWSQYRTEWTQLNTRIGKGCASFYLKYSSITIKYWDDTDCRPDWFFWSQNYRSGYKFWHVLNFQELMHFLLVQMVVCLIFGVKNLGQKAARALKLPVTISFFQRLGEHTAIKVWHCRAQMWFFAGMPIAQCIKSAETFAEFVLR